MTATVMGPEGPIGEVPFEYNLCPTCEGKGSHVDPAMDAGGAHPEEMDPRVREEYFSGGYDQVCNECGGRRVVPFLQAKTTEHEEILRERRSVKEKVRRSRDIQRQERRMAHGRSR